MSGWPLKTTFRFPAMSLSLSASEARNRPMALAARSRIDTSLFCASDRIVVAEMSVGETCLFSTAARRSGPSSARDQHFGGRRGGRRARGLAAFERVVGHGGRRDFAERAMASMARPSFFSPARRRSNASRARPVPASRAARMAFSLVSAVAEGRSSLRSGFRWRGCRPKGRETAGFFGEGGIGASFSSKEVKSIVGGAPLPLAPSIKPSRAASANSVFVGDSAEELGRGVDLFRARGLVGLVADAAHGFFQKLPLNGSVAAPFSVNQSKAGLGSRAIARLGGHPNQEGQDRVMRLGGGFDESFQNVAGFRTGKAQWKPGC